jgi:outer membrane protein TolC
MIEFMPVLRSSAAMGRERFAVSLSQQLPWFGKRDDRAGLAAKEADHQARLYEAVRADVERAVRLAYYDLAFIDEAIAITREDIELLDHFERLAQARYAQGEGPQQAAIKLATETTVLLNQIEELRMRRVDAEAMLNGLMNRPPDGDLPRASLGTRPAPSLDLTELYALARAANPELKAAFEEIEGSQKRIDIARKEYWPDLHVGVSYMNRGLASAEPGGMEPLASTATDSWSLSVGFEIPLGRRKRGAAVLQATEGLIASREGYRAERNNVEVAIRSLAFRLRTLSGQIALLEGTLVPQAGQAFRSAEAAYATGAADVLDLLDSERMLLDIRLGLVQLNADYWKSFAELERVLGARLTEVNP